VKLHHNENTQSGQTLIEVIVALFMLTMTIVAGLSLAIYSNSRNTNNRDALIGSNLAREGIDVVRMMRDTNWLAADDPTEAGWTNNVADLYETAGGCAYSATVHPCYPEAFNDPYDLGTAFDNNDYRVIYDAASPTLWELDSRNGGDTFFLCLQADGSYKHNNTPGAAACTAANAKFARKISLVRGSTAAPYTSETPNPTWNSGHSPEMVVTSYVYWQGSKDCAPFPAANDWDGDFAGFAATTPCKVVIEERLTNWKDYR
jgi:type II secretory pathway pseudopilin PulG